MLKWLFGSKQPQAYAVEICVHIKNFNVHTKWVKVISAKKPGRIHVPRYGLLGIIGPFRSEVDCDECINALMTKGTKQSEAHTG